MQSGINYCKASGKVVFKFPTFSPHHAELQNISEDHCNGGFDVSCYSAECHTNEARHQTNRYNQKLKIIVNDLINTSFFYGKHHEECVAPNVENITKLLPNKNL